MIRIRARAKPRRVPAAPEGRNAKRREAAEKHGGGSIVTTPRKPQGKGFFSHPESVLVFGFLALILVGGILLALPAAAQSGQSIGLFNSFFTATSAVCVTGLVAVDTGTVFSLFGQIVLLALIQVGGLGFMAFATMIMVVLGRKILSIKERMLIRESMNSDSLSDLARLTVMYLLLALGIEGLGMLALAIRFVPAYGPRRGLWLSLFHAVSAFCNAGFDLFGHFSSLTAFSRDPLVLLIVSALIISGGLGFSVILDTLRVRHDARGLSLHTRIVLISTLSLLIAGTVFYLLTEGGNGAALAGFSPGEKVLNAFFQSVTMRTAGFNSVDLASFRDGSKLFSCLLMVIGASPASTGGGLKTTTVAAVLFLMLSVVKGDQEVNVGRRRLAAGIPRRALAIVTLFFVMLMLGALTITLIEDGRFSLADILFETASAMATVGVSAIGTPNLSPASRAVLLPMMFLGRVGPLTLALALAGRQDQVRPVSKYPEERIMIG